MKDGHHELRFSVRANDCVLEHEGHKSPTNDYRLFTRKYVEGD